MSAATGRVIVIGGGVIGAACAHYLSQSGWRVTILDQGRFGEGCSHANCGLVCPSHVLPLAEPGAVGRTLRAMLSPGSPFSIRPRIDLALWGWLFQFARRCNRQAMLEAGRAIQALLRSSRGLYDELIRCERLDCEWETRGLLFVFQTGRAFDHFEDMVKQVREEFGVDATPYAGETVTALEPALKPGLAGGWHYASDAHLRPDKLLTAWRQALEKRGVRVQEDCKVTGWVREQGRARAVQTSRGEQPAEAFVVATGAWTPFLSRELGCTIPIQPGKGYSITMPRPAKCPTLPLLFEEHRVAVTPFRSGYRLGSIMEFAGYDTTLPRARLDLLKSGASHYLQEPYCDPVEEEWFGWRPMTPDSVPIVDRSPTLANVWIAAGHNMLGLSMAPATGKLIAELIQGVPPHLDARPYSARRT
jgi:D-amino-acid dehydrogenase